MDYGDSAEVPDVIGYPKDEALTMLGKWVDIDVIEEQNPDVEAGTVFSQSPEAYAYADPDMPMTIKVSTGDQPPVTPTPEVEAQPTVAADGTWKCTQSLDTPDGYQGGAVRLELVQTVNGMPEASTVLENQTLTFPYKLDITGVPGITEGTLYLSEQIDGTYQELGHYPITFEKVE